LRITLVSIASLVCVCLLSQVASGFEFKAPPQHTSLAVLSGCDSGYLVKDCGNNAKITRTKSYTIELKESLNMDSNDKKPKDTKETKPQAKKPTKDTKKSEKPKKPEPKKLDKDLKKKFEKIKKTTKKTAMQKTKHDTVKNSISNVR
jgi:outer membrane biosynthesis protein TonB